MFKKELEICLSIGNSEGANRVIMNELGKVAITHRGDFIDLLNNSDVPADAKMADAYLADLYFENIHKKSLLLDTAFLVNMHNDLTDEGVKTAYKVMSSSFIGETEEKKSGFIWDTIAKGATGITGKVIDMQHQKKYGAVEALQAQQKAKSDLQASMLAQRTEQIAAINKQKEAKAKNVKIALIAGGSLLGLLLIGVGIYLYKKK